MTAPQRKRKQTDNWRGRIERVPGVLAGKPVIENTRISVELVTDLLEGGRSPDDIVGMYPHITVADVDACRRYKATGAKLSNVTGEDIDAIMDGAYQPKPESCGY